MNHFRQNMPDFINMGDPIEFDFETTEELLASPSLKQYQADGFVGFEYHSQLQSVVAIFDSGYKWWVVGHVSKPITGLKEWKPRYREGEGFNL